MLQLLTKVLESPRAYVAFQKTWGASRLREKCAAVLAANDGEHILDVGCGPAYVLDYLPAVNYVGFDIHSRYVAYARCRYGSRARFVLGPYDDEARHRCGPFDGILLLGILHHLNNSDASRLLLLAAKSLSPEGRVVTLDPCFTQNQSRIARWLAANDRGAHVRSVHGIQALAQESFGSVESMVIEGACRIPSTEIIMKLTRPTRLAGAPA